MTTNDKTRQKLVDSMRKTKAETGTTAETGTDTPPTKAAAPKVKKTRARRDSPKPAGVAGRVTTRPGIKPAKPDQTPSDPYQGARRVWPD